MNEKHYYVYQEWLSTATKSEEALSEKQKYFRLVQSIIKGVTRNTSWLGCINS